MPETTRSAGTAATFAVQAARRFASRTALIHGERRWTFAQFDEQVARLATALRRRFAPGSRVAAFMANRPEYLFLQLAAERAGLVRVPINAKLTATELRAIVEDCEASALFFDATTAERARSLADSASAPCLCAVEDDAFAALLATAAERETLDIADLDDLCSINYTSGSSGRPKGVMLTHRNWLGVYRNMLIDRDLRGDDIVAHVGPLTHASGTYFVPWFLRGATNVLVDGGAEGLLEAIDRLEVTVFTCVPTLLTRVVNHPRFDGYRLGSLRMIGYGAEPIPRNTLEKALARFGPILVQNYGLTEAMMTCATLSADDHFDGPPSEGKLRIGAIGRAYTCVEIVLRDPDGKPVPPGEVGEITIRSEHMTQGYWRMPEETAKVLRDGWLWSGDLAVMDETGLITLAGRSKEMLISGGFNIYPQEVEAALTSLPSVLEAAVVGISDPDWGEIAVAFVSPVPGAQLTAAEIVAQCKPALGIKTPKRIEIVEGLPKNANGKVDKKVLKARLGEAAEAVK